MKIPRGVTRFIGKQKLGIKRNGPTIAFVGGLVGSAVGTVLACRAAVKIVDIADNASYTQKEARSKVLREAAPPVAVLAASYTALIVSHRSMARRNAVLVEAYVGLLGVLEAYRARVRELVGEEEEYKLWNSLETNELSKLPVQFDLNGWHHPYNRFFDESSHKFDSDGVLNYHFLMNAQNVLTDKLQAQGYLFLNDVYDMLGLPRTRIGQITGWSVKTGDEEVLFGLNEAFENAFHYDWGNAILLNFNVDGIAYYHIPEEEITPAQRRALEAIDDD
jgi:Family of unknown function (DUF6353)